MVRRGIAILLAFLICISLWTSFIIIPERLEEFIPFKQPELSHIDHEPFNITSNADFDIQGWEGNGSQSNPYLIENLIITSSGVWVWNTTSHFIIKNCLMSDITLVNVTNAKLIENNLHEVSGYNLSQCVIADNEFNASSTAIRLVTSNFTLIHNNTQDFEPCQYGVQMVGCRQSTVSLNSFEFIMSDGISAWSSYNVSFINNLLVGQLTYLYYPRDGIKLWSGSNYTIRGNKITNFHWSGMDIQGDNHLVEYNNITSSGCGILVSTNGSIVRNNSLWNNIYSIQTVKSNDTTICSNIITGELGDFNTGIEIHGGVDCDIYSNSIMHTKYGIIMQGANGFKISRNTILDSRYGFYFGWDGYSNPHGLEVSAGPSFDCIITDNAFNKGGIFSSILNYESWDFNTIQFVGNTVNGKLIGFYTYLDDYIIDGYDYGQLFLVSCTSVRIIGGFFFGISSDVGEGSNYDPGQAAAITMVNCRYCWLEDVNLQNNTIGINFQHSYYCTLLGSLIAYNSWSGTILWYSHHCYIKDVYFRGNLKGVSLGWSYSSLIADCLVWENDEAIYLVSSPSCEIDRNTVFQNIDALILVESSVCQIWGNSIYSNSRGILLNGSSDCLITENDVYNNSGVGICLDRFSNHNDIYDNTFIDNFPNAICEGSSNLWDDGLSTGNWWSDYYGVGVYVIDEGDIDNYPINRITATPTITTTPTSTVEPWELDPVFLGISGGVVGLVLILVLIIDRRRVEIVD